MIGNALLTSSMLIYNSQNKNNGVAPSTSSLFDENNSSTVTAEIIPDDFTSLDK